MTYKTEQPRPRTCSEQLLPKEVSFCYLTAINIFVLLNNKEVMEFAKQSFTPNKISN